MRSTQIDLFGMSHVKVDFFVVQKMCVIQPLGSFVWSTWFGQCGSVTCNIRAETSVVLWHWVYFSLRETSLFETRASSFELFTLKDLAHVSNRLNSLTRSETDPLYRRHTLRHLGIWNWMAFTSEVFESLSVREGGSHFYLVFWISFSILVFRKEHKILGPILDGK